MLHYFSNRRMVQASELEQRPLIPPASESKSAHTRKTVDHEVCYAGRQASRYWKT